MARKSKKQFRPVDPRVDFPKLEKEILSRWYKKGAVDEYLAKNKYAKKTFSFLDGPITANNPMGVHHAWNRTYKDLWQRYKNMQGFRQRFQNGFDAQGLWVEVEVEKELGLESKRDIENLVPGDKKKSIARFVELCKERVFRFAKIQTEQSKRLGYFMDWENSYYTLSDENNYMIWHFLAECHKKGLIYKGVDSVPWCPRCGTAISQHEISTEEYKELTHDTVFFKVPVVEKDFSFLVWTTTPWTVPANVALAVNPKFKYVVWETKNKEGLVTVDPGEIEDPESKEWFEQNILSEELAKTETIKGKDLIGLHYEGPFDELERVKKAREEKPETFHTVVDAEDLVVATKGTGVLHVAPGAGQEDFQLGKEKDLPVIDVIDEDAKYLPGMDQFSDQNAKEHPELILDYLKEKDGGRFLFKVTPLSHRYPQCWRCRTELVWRVVDEWYISMGPLRQPMKKVTRKINWIPGFGLKRELDWLDNMHDWLISKKRYWGLALPIWECQDCGWFDVIANSKELEQRAILGWEEFKDHSPHRPWIDEVKVKCEECGGEAGRIPDVGTPWLDAGIVPFSTILEGNKGEPLYLKDPEKWRQWFPADFITESFPGQFRNWFYSLIAMSTVLENEEPFKTVLGFATLLAEDGRAMHKSWGNAIEFNEGADKIGVDVMRWIYAKQDPAQNLLFGYKMADQTRRSFHLTLWNVYNFFVTYANLDGWQPELIQKVASSTLLDSWITLRLRETIIKVTDSLDGYDAKAAASVLEEFVQDLSLWYVRRSRERVGPNAPDGEDKDSCHTNLWITLITLSRVLASFMPFLAEEIYQNLQAAGRKGSSIHLTNWPTEKELKAMAGGLSEKQISENLSLMVKTRKIVERGHAERKKVGIPVRQPLAKITVFASYKKIDEVLLSLIKYELNVKTVDWRIKKNLKEPEVKLDTKLTLELEEEGKTRELARKIQDERKRMGVKLDAKVKVVSPWVPEEKKLVEWLKLKTLATDIKKGKKLQVVVY